MALWRDEVNKTTQSQGVEPIISGIQDDSSTDDKTIADIIYLQLAAGNFSGEQVCSQRVTNLLFYRVPHWAGAKFGMKTFTDQKRQDRLVQSQHMTAPRQKFNFIKGSSPES